MSFGIYEKSPGIRPSVKRRLFISYHHDGDQVYYDAFSKTFSDTYDVITDNSLERAINSEDAEYVMRRVRENYITGSSCTIVLVGVSTWGRKYIDWEIKATLDKQHGLLGVQLPTLQAGPNGKVSVPDRLYDNINSGFALWLTWAQITCGTQACAEYVELATLRDKQLILNNRDLRLYNA